MPVFSASRRLSLQLGLALYLPNHIDKCHSGMRKGWNLPTYHVAEILHACLASEMANKLLHEEQDITGSFWLAQPHIAASVMGNCQVMGSIPEFRGDA